jgi:hypothetical protein
MGGDGVSADVAVLVSCAHVIPRQRVAVEELEVPDEAHDGPPLTSDDLLDLLLALDMNAATNCPR